MWRVSGSSTSTSTPTQVQNARALLTRQGRRPTEDGDRISPVVEDLLRPNSAPETISMPQPRGCGHEDACCCQPTIALNRLGVFGGRAFCGDADRQVELICGPFFRIDLSYARILGRWGKICSSGINFSVRESSCENAHQVERSEKMREGVVQDSARGRAWGSRFGGAP